MWLVDPGDCAEYAIPEHDAIGGAYCADVQLQQRCRFVVSGGAGHGVCTHHCCGTLGCRCGASPISKGRPPPTETGSLRPQPGPHGCSGFACGKSGRRPYQDVGRSHALSGDARAPGARAGSCHEEQGNSEQNREGVTQ